MKKHTSSQEKQPADRKKADRSFIIGFVLTALFFLFCLLFLPVRYETNDDFGNIRTFTDLSGFEGDSFNPFLSRVLGYFLYAFYQAMPQIPWYGLTVYLTLFLGVFLMTSVMLRHGNAMAFFICLPPLGLFLFHSLVLTNYTTAAMMVEVGVFLSCAEWALRNKCPARKPVVYAGLLTIGIALAYLLRWKLALWGLAFGIPVLFFIRPAVLRKIWLPAFALLAFIAADRLLCELPRSDETKQYLAYDELRRVFHDTAKGEFYEDRTPAALQKTGWELEDYRTFKNWVLYDDALFNIASLETFLSKNAPRTSTSLLQMIPTRLKNSFLKSKHYSLIFLTAFSAMILAFAAGARQWSIKDLSHSFSAIGTILAIILFFAFYRFEPRIYLPLFSYVICLTFLVLKLKTSMPVRIKWHFRECILILLAIALTLFSYRNMYTKIGDLFRVMDYSKKEKRYVVDCLEKVIEKKSETNPILIMMNPTDSLATQSVHPLKEMMEYPPVRLMPSGTSVNSPRYFKILHAIGLKSGREFLEWAIDNDQVLFVIMARSNKQQKTFISLWESYYNRHIDKGKRFGLAPVMDFRNSSGVGLILFQLRSTNLPRMNTNEHG